MTVLHGAWIPARRDHHAGFALWGEQAPARVKPRPMRRRPRARHHLPPHPFALSADALRHLLSTLDLGQWATQASVRTAGARLPSLGETPQRSGEAVEDASALTLALWEVPAIVLDEAAAVLVLPRLAAATAENPSLLADDLRAWIVAARFALSLLARQQFVPGLRLNDGLLQARWAPALDDPSDRGALEAIQASLPPAATALAWDEADERLSARDALADYLAATLDTVARRVRPLARPPSRRPNPEDAWLDALSRPSARVELPSEQGQRLLRQVGIWSNLPSVGEGGEAFRLCFRLDPPSDGTPQARSWTLAYLLQATDDPSLVVPVAEVWRRRGATARFLTRRFDQPQERVLASLGRASRLFPAVEASLRTARPESCALSTREAADLVRDKALLLKAAGFGVLLPGLETRLSVRLRFRDRRPAAPRAEGATTLGLERIVAYDWQLSLGDEPLTPEEFEMLAHLKEPLVQLRGKWVDLRPDQVERALAFIRRHADGTMELGEALATALDPGTLDGLPVSGVEAAGWVDSLLSDLRQGARVELEAEPEGFVGQLRPYQRRGVDWLATLTRHGLGALLADDMGLGKTPTTIALLLLNRQAGDEGGPTLVVSPTSVVGNWRHELERFAPSLRVHVHHGADRASAEELAAIAAEHDVILSTYALLHRDEPILTGVAWDGLVLDEAQNVKNPATRAAQVARALPARWRVALTGTPVENRLADLWSIFQVLNPGYLGSAEHFRRTFALPIERAADADATARLKALTAPFILRRVKTDRAIIADLPEKQEMKVYCTLTREQATLYEAVVNDTMRTIAESEGVQRRGLVLALLAKLKQVCDHPALLLHDASALAGRSGKLARLSEMLEEVLAVDERALVFTQYAEMGGLLREYLAASLDREVIFLHGGTPMAERDRLVARFQSDTHGPPIFLLSLRAGGTGLNLTRANHVFHFDRWWNPAVENQATDRAFRIGQTRDVQVHKFVCAGTFEEALDELIERKTGLAQSIVGTGEAWITEMSNDELRDLFRLRHDAVED